MQFYLFVVDECALNLFKPLLLGGDIEYADGLVDLDDGGAIRIGLGLIMPNALYVFHNT